MELTEIDGLADDLLEKLRDSTSAADVRDLVFRLDGLYRGAQIKALLSESVEQGQCGFRWSWGEGADGSHFEICTLPAGHGGTRHLNEVTGINKRKVDCTCVWTTRQAMSGSNTIPGSHHDDTCPLYLRNFADPPTKPVADRLHELASYCMSWETLPVDAEAAEMAAAGAYRDIGRKLEALLMEGGI